jgi:DnaJ-class molecular chaperone
MATVDDKTHYELLGLEPSATTDEIKEAYREIARIFHPDSNFYDDIVGDEMPEGESDVFKAITNAYQILSNPQKRKSYDESLVGGLGGWETDDSGAATHRARRQDIPEEWRREREYFEQNYQEIFRASEKSDLVGGEESPDSEIGEWGETEEERQAIIDGFGDVSTAQEMKAEYSTAPTRRPVKYGGFHRDPVWYLIYVGMPAVVAVVLVELYLIYIVG